MSVEVDRWAATLLAAADDRREIEPITHEVAALSLDDAYAIQDAWVALRLARGERLVGAKLGLTSRAKQEQMGVREPIYAWLTSQMWLPSEVQVDLSRFVHPRAEPEIAFLLGADLAGPGVTAHDVLAATEAVCAGIEIIDSRYRAFSFTLPDVVADDASSSGFVLGTARRPADALDLALLGCTFEVDGDVVSTATGAATMGHPAEAVAMLANHVGRRGQKLTKGMVILSGGLTAAVPLKPGTHVAAHFADLGRVDVVAKGEAP